MPELWLWRELRLESWPSSHLCVSLCPCLSLSQCNRFLSGVAQHSSSFYSAVRLALTAPLNCWRNSTPFWCKASLCMIKNDNFRTYGPNLLGLSLFVLQIEWKNKKSNPKSFDQILIFMIIFSRFIAVALYHICVC